MSRISPDTYATVFSAAYLGMVTNVLLVVGSLPLVIVLLTTDTAMSWPIVAVLAPLAAPALAAAFAVFAAYSVDPTTGVIRTFVRSWRATFRRATTLGAIVVAALIVLGVDARAAWGRPVGIWALPALTVLVVLVVATGTLGLVLVAELPDGRLRDVLRAASFLAVRRWYLTLASLLVAALLLTLFTAKPALAMGFAAAPLLYVVWANSRYTLRRVLPVRGAAAAA